VLTCTLYILSTSKALTVRSPREFTELSVLRLSLAGLLLLLPLLLLLHVASSSSLPSLGWAFFSAFCSSLSLSAALFAPA